MANTTNNGKAFPWRCLSDQKATLQPRLLWVIYCMQNACVVLHRYQSRSTPSFIDMRLGLYRFWFQLIATAFKLRPVALVFPLGYQYTVCQERVLIAVYLIGSKSGSDGSQDPRLEQRVIIRMLSQQKCPWTPSIPTIAVVGNPS
jgi:hypothetical protein